MLLLFPAAKGEKSLRHQFKKLELTVKGATSASAGTDGPTGASSTGEVGGKSLSQASQYHPSPPSPPSLPSLYAHTQSVPQVDEEGYSIRPEDAATISQFPDEPRERGEHSDSDSDSEEGRWIH